MRQVFGVIPARMASSRFPGKPLHRIAGKPMIQYAIDASLGYAFDSLVVATPDAEIADFVASRYRADDCGVIMTSTLHERALERVAETAEIMGLDGKAMMLCVQADEPLISTGDIEIMAELIRAAYPVVLAAPIADSGQFHDPNTVKLVTNRNDRVLYTSRQPIPSDRLPGDSLFGWRVGGVFGFTVEILSEFALCRPSLLERAESCDMNRWLDNIVPVIAVRMGRDRKYFSVDAPGDVARVEAVLASQGAGQAAKARQRAVHG